MKTFRIVFANNNIVSAFETDEPVGVNAIISEDNGNIMSALVPAASEKEAREIALNIVINIELFYKDRH
jgi:hypothetical protein